MGVRVTARGSPISAGSREGQLLVGHELAVSQTWGTLVVYHSLDLPADSSRRERETPTEGAREEAHFSHPYRGRERTWGGLKLQKLHVTGWVVGGQRFLRDDKVLYKARYFNLPVKLVVVVFP